MVLQCEAGACRLGVISATRNDNTIMGVAGCCGWATSPRATALGAQRPKPLRVWHMHGACNRVVLSSVLHMNEKATSAHCLNSSISQTRSANVCLEQHTEAGFPRMSGIKLVFVCTVQLNKRGRAFQVRATPFEPTCCCGSAAYLYGAGTAC